MAGADTTTARARERTAQPLDGAMRTAITVVAAATLVMTLGALAIFGWSEALGVAVGGLLATANLWAFAHVGRGVLAGGRKARVWGLFGALKLLTLMGVVYLLIKSGLVPVLALVVGYAALPLGTAVGNFVGPRPGDDDPELQRDTGDLTADLVTGPPPDAAPGD